MPNPLLVLTLTSVRFIRFEWAEPVGERLALRWFSLRVDCAGHQFVRDCSCVASLVLHRGLLSEMFHGMVLICFARLDSRVEF